MDASDGGGGAFTVNDPEDVDMVDFNGDGGLYFTRLGEGQTPAIRYAAYTGGESAVDYANNANWSDAVNVITADEFVLKDLAAVGEPTVAVVDGKPTLYFVYASIRGFDAVSGLPDINMQAGFIAQK